MKVKRFNKNCQKVFLMVCAIFIIGMTYSNSFEYNLNISIKETEKEIEVLNGDIDGLEMEKSNLTDFKKIYDIATNSGYQYRTNTDVAVVSKSE